MQLVVGNCLCTVQVSGRSCTAAHGTWETTAWHLHSIATGLCKVMHLLLVLTCSAFCAAAGRDTLSHTHHPHKRAFRVQATQYAIPKILHQSWKSANVPAKFSRWQTSWRNQHPTWEYRCSSRCGRSCKASLTCHTPHSVVSCELTSMRWEAHRLWTDQDNQELVDEHYPWSAQCQQLLLSARGCEICMAEGLLC